MLQSPTLGQYIAVFTRLTAHTFLVRRCSHELPFAFWQHAAYVTRFWSVLRRRRGLAPRTASFGLRVRTLYPILMPESLASTVPPRLHICPILPRRASAARKKRMDKQLFSLSLTMILSNNFMNVKQISRFCKIIWNDACFFLLLSSIFSSCVFSLL